MNKQEIINKYLVEEDKLLVSKLLDKIEFVQKKNSIENTDFLDMRQRGILEKVLKALKIENYIVYGGAEIAERTIIIIYPEKLEKIFKEGKFDYNNLIQIIRIMLPSETRGNYSHRDYLGALMKLGVKREKIGDILVSIDGADIIILKEIANYLLTELPNLTRFSKSEVRGEKIEELNILEPKKQLLKIIVPSMRIDSIVSEVIKTSRAKANEIIKQERVFVDFELISKNSKLVKEGAILTVRGKGRFKIGKIINNTKKGNLVLEIEKYI